MFEVLIQDIQEICSTPRLLTANIFSMLAAISLLISCVVQKRRTMFLFQAGQCALLTVTQVILGMYGSVVTTTLGCVRDTANAFDKMNPKRAVALAATIGVVGVTVNFMVGGPWYGVLTSVAAVIYSLGCQVFRKPNLLRINLMVNLCFWVAYSFIIKDYITVLTNGFTAAVDLFAFFVILIQENRAKRGIVIGKKN